MEDETAVGDAEQREIAILRKAHRFKVWRATATRHSPLEDTLGILAGGMAGLAFVIHYLTGWNFGLVFFTLNLPFYLLAIGRIGRAFTIKTAFAVALLSLMTAFSADFVKLSYPQPLLGTALGGLLVGFGLLPCSVTAPAPAVWASSPWSFRTVSAGAPD